MTLFLVPMLFPTCSREQGLYVVPLFPTPIGGNMGNRVTLTSPVWGIRNLFEGAGRSPRWVFYSLSEIMRLCVSVKSFGTLTNA